MAGGDRRGTATTNALVFHAIGAPQRVSFAIVLRIRVEMMACVGLVSEPAFPSQGSLILPQLRHQSRNVKNLFLTHKRH